MTTENKLPAARLVPKDRAEQMALLRSQASDGARKAGRTAFALGKGLSVFALCGAGLVLVGNVGRSRSHQFDDLDQRMKTIRQLGLQPLPKFEKFDNSELERIRTQLYRDVMDPKVGSPYRRYQFQQLELVGEPLHQSR